MRTQLTLDAIAIQLQQNCGDMLAACKAVGVSLIFVNQWRKDDKKVDEVILEAERVGTQGLVSAAIARGVEGVDKAVWYKGQIVGYEKQYSDGLLQTLLKAKVPEFAKDGEGTGLQVNVQVANIMPRAANYTEWLAMKDQTVNRALPAPNNDHVIEAEYVTVETPFTGIEL